MGKQRIPQMSDFCCMPQLQVGYKRCARCLAGLFTGVRGRGLLGNSHPGSCMVPPSEPRESPESPGPTETLPTRPWRPSERVPWWRRVFGG
jgi:hypothetical protein